MTRMHAQPQCFVERNEWVSVKWTVVCYGLVQDRKEEEKKTRNHPETKRDTQSERESNWQRKECEGQTRVTARMPKQQRVAHANVSGTHIFRIGPIV